MNKIFEDDKLKFNIEEILNIAHQAGQKIMEIYNKDFEIEYKDDKSPLTQADKKSHEVITKSLEKFNIPILSEEGKNIPYAERKEWEYFWMIDPIDGTKEFIKKNGEFTINIALIKNNKPIFGVVYAPAIDKIFFTDNNNSYEAKLTINRFSLVDIKQLPYKQNKKFVIVASKSHLTEETKEFIDKLQTEKEKEFISFGSSLKLCMVANGSADIYPRLAPTMEWDTAAADAIVRKANKMSYIFEESLETPLKYNKENLLNPFFIVK